MDKEEKAKAYDEALERARERYEKVPDSVLGLSLVGIFPELRESDDERIKKAIIKILKGETTYTSNENTEEYVNWLEKQGNEPIWCHHKVDLSDCTEEYRKAYYDGWDNCNQQHAQLEAQRKPTWSEEDEEELGIAIKYLQRAGQWDSATWLKSLKERVQPQPRQWGDEDEKMLDFCIKHYADGNCITWLESLKERMGGK